MAQRAGRGPGRHHCLQQGRGQLEPSLERQVSRHLTTPPPLRPADGQVQRAVYQSRSPETGIGQKEPGRTNIFFARFPAVLPGHPRRLLPFLAEGAAVRDQHPFRIPQNLPHFRPVPGQDGVFQPRESGSQSAPATAQHCNLGPADSIPYLPPLSEFIRKQPLYMALDTRHLVAALKQRGDQA